MVGHLGSALPATKRRFLPAGSQLEPRAGLLWRRHGAESRCVATRRGIPAEGTLGHMAAPKPLKLGAVPKRGIKGSVAPHVGKATAQGALCSCEDGAHVGPQGDARFAILLTLATAGNR